MNRRPKKNFFFNLFLMILKVVVPVTVCFGLLVCAQMFLQAVPSPQVINYSDFVKMAIAGKISSVSINGTDAQGEFNDGTLFKASIMVTPDVLNALLAKDVQIDLGSSLQSSGTGIDFTVVLVWCATVLLLIGLIYFIFMRGGGMGPGKMFNFTRSKAKLFMPNTTKVTFDDVAGLVDVKEDLQEVIDFLKNPEKFKKMGARIPRGVLLAGDPGNGKTLLAKAVAGEANCPFLTVSGADFVEMFVGVGASRVRDLFLQARKSSPCIVFIDEIDAVGRQRSTGGMGGANDEREQTLNQLLAEMDGFATEPGAVIILAATNRVDILDKALRRPGRFDRTIEVPPPDMKSREQILKVHARNVPMSTDIDYESLARGTSGFSGADLANLVNEAALLATKRDAEFVVTEDFESARDKILVGGERKTLFLTEEGKRKTAYHEAGHALLNVLLEKTDPFHKVTIIPRGSTLGVSWSMPIGDVTSRTISELEQRIMIALGGLVAEKMVYNETSTGASSDLMNATKIARGMVCYYGMSKLGVVYFAGSAKQASYDQLSVEHSEATAEKIDQAVLEILNDLKDRTEKMLLENRDKFELLATTLFEKETLGAKEVYELLGLPERASSSFESAKVEINNFCR